MKNDKNILFAFILNLLFSLFEFIGGIITNSVAILSDSIHDLGDSLSIGVSYFLEKKSQKSPDDKYTFGYIRYSVIGSLITTTILLIGSLIVIYNAINRIINPVLINYNKMIIFALLGTIINFIAAYLTRRGESLNQKAVNLHMIEDVLGWCIVLFGSIIMRFTNIAIIDPILSILVALFILVNVFKNIKTAIDIFLEKTPSYISISKIKEELLKIKNVKGIHHIHLWSIDGFKNYATMHIICSKDIRKTKEDIRKKLLEFNIHHVTLEIESLDEICDSLECKIESQKTHHHHH